MRSVLYSGSTTGLTSLLVAWTAVDVLFSVTNDRRARERPFFLRTYDTGEAAAGCAGKNTCHNAMCEVLVVDGIARCLPHVAKGYVYRRARRDVTRCSRHLSPEGVRLLRLFGYHCCHFIPRSSTTIMSMMILLIQQSFPLITHPGNGQY